ncbi:MAG: hypothetical protein ACHQ3P_09930 [Candidatus Limnocylindrales bacterium]
MDRPAARPVALQVALLVLVAALLEEEQLGVLAMVRPFPAALEPTELERGEVVAGKLADEVGGTDDDRAVDALHVDSRTGRMTR